jgi:hypothetical protein
VICSTFLECPHPDENMRLALAEKLGLTVHQVKFWFQNRRTAKKVVNLFMPIILRNTNAHFISRKACT